MTWESRVAVWDDTAAHRVLVVDDDDAMARMIRLTLLSEGYVVTTASDGIEGLEKLEQGGFALVVLDLQMPNMDGRQMFTEMKRRGINVPVVIVSAYGAEAAREELNAAAAIRKPFDTAVLLEKIQSLLA
jgi:two-component system, response regulator, stage 0 sporulation protein F